MKKTQQLLGRWFTGVPKPPKASATKTTQPGPASEKAEKKASAAQPAAKKASKKKEGPAASAAGAAGAKKKRSEAQPTAAGTPLIRLHSSDAHQPVSSPPTKRRATGKRVPRAPQGPPRQPPGSTGPPEPSIVRGGGVLAEHQRLAGRCRVRLAGPPASSGVASSAAATTAAFPEAPAPATAATRPPTAVDGKADTDEEMPQPPPLPQALSHCSDAFSALPPPPPPPSSSSSTSSSSSSSSLSSSSSSILPPPPQAASPTAAGTGGGGGLVRATSNDDGSAAEEQEHLPEEETDDNEGLSEYELRRLANIRRNQAVLASLGLDRPIGQPVGGVPKSKKKKVRKRSRISSVNRDPEAEAAAELARSLSYRRSARLRGGGGKGGETGGKDDAELDADKLQKAEEEKEEEFVDDSSVMRYVCSDTGGGARSVTTSSSSSSSSSGRAEAKCDVNSSTATSSRSPTRGVKWSRRFPHTYADDALKKVYGMDFLASSQQGGQIGAPPSLFAIGGHGGRVAVFGLDVPPSDENDETGDGDDGGGIVAPLLSFKAHVGWISGVALVGGDGCTSSSSSSSSGGGGGGGGGGSGSGSGSGSGAAQRLLMLTASNDKQVILWDLKTQSRRASEAAAAAAAAAEGEEEDRDVRRASFSRAPSAMHAGRRKMYATQTSKPKVVTQLSSLHSHGIFCLDVCRSVCGSSSGAGGGGGGIKVATGSKDCSISLSCITPTGLRRVTSLPDAHESVVKCVRFRDSHTLASAGNDRALKIIDLRSPRASSSSGGSGGGCGRDFSVEAIEDAHDQAVNSVRWHPTDDHLVLSASFDRRIRLFDLRRISAGPLFEYTGHVAPGVHNAKLIYHPVFLDGGSCILTPGDKADYLSLYCTKTGSTISRGAIGTTATAVASCPGGEGCDLVAVACESSGRQIRFMDPF